MVESLTGDEACGSHAICCSGACEAGGVTPVPDLDRWTFTSGLEDGFRRAANDPAIRPWKQEPENAPEIWLALPSCDWAGTSAICQPPPGSRFAFAKLPARKSTAAVEPGRDSAARDSCVTGPVPGSAVSSSQVYSRRHVLVPWLSRSRLVL